MSKNKKKKLKKKEKQKQKMLELTQQQIQVRFLLPRNLFIFNDFQDAEKQKQNLLSSPNQINLKKLALTDPSKPGKSKINI